MTMNTVYGILALIGLVALVIFTFRLGTKVPPSGRDPTDHVQPPTT